MDGYKTIYELSRSDFNGQNNVEGFYMEPPKIHAVYRFTDTDEITDDVRLKYFKMPKPTSYPINLNEGFEQFVFRRNLQQKKQIIIEVIKYVMESNDSILCPRKPSESQTFSEAIKAQHTSERKLVLTHRAVLLSIMMTPYQKFLPKNGNHIGSIYATKYCGILHIIDSDKYNERTIIQTHHGKFEQICFSNDPDEDPITDVPVDQNNTNFCVYRSSLKEFDLIYSAEIAGILADRKIEDVNNLDEINSSKMIVTKLNWQSNRDILTHPKCLYWWIQAYLANTDNICIGIKDRDGFIRTPVQLKRAKDLLKNQYWKPVICIRFLHTMLSLIENTMSRVNCPYTTYEFKYDAFGKCIKYKIHNGKTEYSFLQEDYIKHCKERTNCK